MLAGCLLRREFLPLLAAKRATRQSLHAAGANAVSWVAKALDIDYAKKSMVAGGQVVKQGDWITIDGNDGEVFEGEVPLVTPELPPLTPRS